MQPSPDHILFLVSSFFFNDTATTEIYTLSLHDALPISPRSRRACCPCSRFCSPAEPRGDRKSTRLNSSHRTRSYAVFCLKKKIIAAQKINLTNKKNKKTKKKKKKK